jgi:hypothetical protein
VLNDRCHVTLYSHWDRLEDIQKRALVVLSEEGKGALPALPEAGKLDPNEDVQKP